VTAALFILSDAFFSFFQACYGIFSGNIDSAENDSKIQTEATVVIHVFNHSR